MNFMNRFKKMGYAAFLTMLSCWSLSSFAVTTPQEVMVNVDFAVSTPQKNMSGFLHAVGKTDPPDSLILPLKPALWRIRAGDNINYARAVNAGAQIQVVLSDGYGYPNSNWKGNGAPWENNWSNWENFVRQMAQVYRNTPVYWEVWNEPDVKKWNTYQFWNGTQAQFFETYKRAYTILRQELGPNVMIGGPGYANYEPTNTKAFLDYCQQNGLQVNFLTWHELMKAENNISTVASNISTMRTVATSYPDLAIQKIFINESVGPRTQYFPGDILAFLYYIELGGADAANKGCWLDTQGKNNCSNNSLDGILNHVSNGISSTAKPRAAWWAYKTYADVINNRVQTTSSNPNLVALASKTPSQVLLGYHGLTAPGPAKVTVRFKNLPLIGQKGGYVQVTISKVPNTGEATLNNLVPVASLTTPVVYGTTRVFVPLMNLHEEYIVTVSPVP